MFANVSILLSPILPVWLLAVLAIAFGWLSWRTYRNCGLPHMDMLFLWSLRMLTFLLLAGLLLLPSRRWSTLQKTLPLLAVVVDQSASMEDSPQPGTRTRLQRAGELLSSGKVKQALSGFRLSYYAVGEELSELGKAPATLTATDARTYLTAGLNSLAERLRGENLAGILLLTDGLDQSVESLDEKARKVPVLLPELEEPRREEPEVTDYSFGDVSHPRRVTVGSRGKLNFTVKRNRDAAATEVAVILRQEGREVSQGSIAFKEQALSAQGDFPLEFAATGNLLYELEIVSPEDAREENNLQEFVIEVTEQQKRILYLEGVPRWDFKFLKRALSTEKDLHLTAFLQGPQGAFLNFDEAPEDGGNRQLPVFSDEGLHKFSLVILGELEENSLPEESRAALARFVERGGGLLLAGGSRLLGDNGLARTEELAAILPVKLPPDGKMAEGHFAPLLTAAARNNQSLSGLAKTSLPSLLSIWEPVEVTGGGTVLLQTRQENPLLVTGRAGQGRVAVLLSDSFWQWQLGTAAGEDKLYGNFFLRLLESLAPDLQAHDDGRLEILLPEREVSVHAKCLIGVLGGGSELPPGGLSCRVQKPDGSDLTLPLATASLGQDFGLSTATPGHQCLFRPAEPGAYQVEILAVDGRRSTREIVIARLPEHERTGAPLNRQWLQQTAVATGGQMMPPERLPEAIRQLPRRHAEYSQTREEPLWNHWLWIALLITLHCLEWYWRRRRDLV